MNEHAGRVADDLVTLKKARNEFEANLIVALLEEEQIEAFAFTQVRSMIPLETRLISVPVQVRRSDLERAQSILNEHGPEAGAEINWDSVDVGERDDRLPLREPGRTPAAARLATFIAWMILLATIAGLILVFVL